MDFSRGGLGIAAVLLWGIGSGLAADKEAISVVGPELAISIAVPEVDGVRPIFGDGPAAHFHVVLRNCSQQEVRIWRSGNSWGHGALSFRAQTGAAKPMEIRRRQVPWLQNAPTVQQLAPGDSYVVDVYFASDDWESFPRSTDGEPFDVKLRAVYEVSRDKAAEKHGVWTGRIESEARTYRFEPR